MADRLSQSLLKRVSVNALYAERLSNLGQLFNLIFALRWVESSIQLNLLKTHLRKSYNEHVLTHIKTKDVECEICFKKYRTQKHLKRHKARIHSSKSKLPCPECKQHFSTAKGTGSWNHCLIFDAQYYIESILRTRTSY